MFATSDPLGRFALSLIIKKHFPIGLLETRLGNDRTGQLLEKFADRAAADNRLKPAINLLADGDCDLVSHPLQESYTQRHPSKAPPPALASEIDAILHQMGECPAQARLCHLDVSPSGSSTDAAIGPPAVGQSSWQSAARAQARLLHCHERQRSSSAIPAVSADSGIPRARQPPNRSEATRPAVALT